MITNIDQRQKFHHKNKRQKTFSVLVLLSTTIIITMKKGQNMAPHRFYE